MHAHTAPTSRPRRWISIGLFATVVVAAGVAVAEVVSGAYQIQPILSGSMQPGLPVGGIVIAQRVPTPTLQVRDVIVFHPPSQPEELVVHRIIALTAGTGGPVVQTQGDANAVPDPWKATLRGASAYRVVVALPLIGYGAVWAHGPAGRSTLIVLGSLLILGAALGALVQRRRAAHAKAPPATELPPVRQSDREAEQP